MVIFTSVRAAVSKKARQLWKRENLYLLLLLSAYSFFLIHQIDISGGDLGRHLKNGEIILDSLRTGQSLQPILTTNFYSETFSAVPFTNHHWGSGLIFFAVWQLVGYGGLILFFTLLSLVAFIFFWWSIPATRRTSLALVVGI